MPLRIRFRFHFEGNRTTNRLDKPEWMFWHTLEVFNKYRIFMIEELQPLLDEFGYIEFDAVHQFILSFLPCLLERIHKTSPFILSQPKLLSHFVHETQNFDAVLLREYNFRYPGRDLTSEFLNANSNFATWLSAERNCMCFIELWLTL